MHSVSCQAVYGSSAHLPETGPLIDPAWLPLCLAQGLGCQLMHNDRHAQVCVRQHQHAPAHTRLTQVTVDLMTLTLFTTSYT